MLTDFFVFKHFRWSLHCLLVFILFDKFYWLLFFCLCLLVSLYISFYFLTSFKILIFFMVMHNFILICLGVYFFGFILLTVHWAYLIQGLTFFIKSGFFWKLFIWIFILLLLLYLNKLFYIFPQLTESLLSFFCCCCLAFFGLF